ncbi:hypothetical protein CSUI_002491 [Cystoisospora suis]|uniref:Uncharacterized protein n=1 Tax=Cystoisospora suis TaxID=483139 RepID=A0A2C6L8W0_9APIC|nr:hypothetical protein CSUI_002491 [Cystoisospora suis]
MKTALSAITLKTDIKLVVQFVAVGLNASATFRVVNESKLTTTGWLSPADPTRDSRSTWASKRSSLSFMEGSVDTVFPPFSVPCGDPGLSDLPASAAFLAPTAVLVADVPPTCPSLRAPFLCSMIQAVSSRVSGSGFTLLLTGRAARNFCRLLESADSLAWVGAAVGE